MYKTTTNPTTLINKQADSSPEFKLFIGCIPGKATDEEILSVLSNFA